MSETRSHVWVFVHTVDPDSIDEGIDSMTIAIVAKLKEEGLIR
jgi:hypothetical protein